METVTIQCGACGQVIAVSKAHLGQQVQCPLCGAVIEAPPPQPAVAPPGNDEDSIFAPPEEEEDIFGRRDERPLVQMPSETTLAPKPQKHKRAEDRTEAMPGGQLQPVPRSATLSDSANPLADHGSATELAGLGVQRPRGSGNLGTILMIFLIPYAIVTTFVVIYLVYERNQRGGLDLLPDPEQNDGAPRRVKHDLALPGSLRTTLGNPLALGDILITPLTVGLTHHNDLVLHLKMQNTSRDTQLNPFPDSLHRYMTRHGTPIPPYTFLSQSKRSTDMRIYGGYTARYRQPPDKRDNQDDGAFSGVIGPQEVVYCELVTTDKDRHIVPRMLARNEELLWRVHVRRGFVRSGGRNVSATGVFGVEFSASAVVRN